MPEISRFYGVIVKMFYGDHSPPHFHASYSGQEAVIEITTLSVKNGSLPPRALGMVIEWATLHRRELLEYWELARQSKPIGKIDPLA